VAAEPTAAAEPAAGANAAADAAANAAAAASVEAAVAAAEAAVAAAEAAAAGALEINRPWWLLLALLPAVGTAVAFYVIARCRALAHAHGYLPPGVTYHPISLFGFAPDTEERALYVNGFAAVTAIFLFGLPSFYGFVARFESRAKVNWLFGTAIIAFAGLFLHAWYPLQHDILAMQNIDRMDGKLWSQAIEDPIGALKNGANMQRTTGLHTGAAAVFFMASLGHCYASVSMLWAAEELPLGVAKGGKVRRFFHFLLLLSSVDQLWSMLLTNPCPLRRSSRSRRLRRSGAYTRLRVYMIACPPVSLL